MWFLNPVARAVIGHGAYKMVSTGGQATVDSTSFGTAAESVDGVLTGSGAGWISNQVGAGSVGVSYCGQNFVLPREIRRVDFWSFNAAGDYDSSSNKLQYSFDGSTWVDHSIFTMRSASVNVQTFLLERSVKAPQWRLLCNATPSAGGNRWGLAELRMYVML